MTTFSSAPLWYVTRSAGLVSFVLVTLALSLGVAATQRALASRSWPRFATQALHRNIALLGLALLGVHIVSTVVDSYVNMGWSTVLVPGTSGYRPFAVSLGTLAFDLLLLIAATSLVRLRLPQRMWRAVHLTAYAVWPLSLVHFLRAGTDVHGTGLLLAGACSAVVLGAVGIRLATRDEPVPLRTIARAHR